MTGLRECHLEGAGGEEVRRRGQPVPAGTGLGEGHVDGSEVAHGGCRPQTEHGEAAGRDGRRVLAPPENGRKIDGNEELGDSIHRSPLKYSKSPGDIIASGKVFSEERAVRNGFRAEGNRWGWRDCEVTQAEGSHWGARRRARVPELQERRE